MTNKNKIIVKCMTQYINKALTNHQMHLDKSSTATDKSQEKLMKYLKKAIECKIK